jgi:hypothetical protein
MQRSMESWVQLFAVTGASAATLLGLLFVAVSINAQAALTHPNSQRMAEQAFQNYLVVVLVSLLALFPSLKISELGWATLGLTALRGGAAAVRLYWAAVKPYETSSRWQSLRRQSLPLVGFALLIYATARMALGWGDSRTSFAIAVLILLLSATTASWELLLRIAREKR